MYRLLRFYNQNRHRIWFAIIVIAFVIFIPFIYPHGITAILVSFLVLYVLEYPILNPFGSVFISATSASIYPTFLSPILFVKDNLPVKAEPDANCI